ncbi:MAG: hypothetical protein WCJ64_04900 [Rhodospirillaceae bacterium]
MAAPWHEKTRANLNRFKARYDLARRFSGIEATQYSPETLRGYSSGIRVMLAYSASEQLAHALGENVLNWNINNKDIANALRLSLKKIPIKLDSYVSSATLATNFSSFMDGSHDNIRVPATVIRVMVAHGAFTPTGADSFSKASVNALDRLSEALLNECVTIFNRWLLHYGGAP